MENLTENHLQPKLEPERETAIRKLQNDLGRQFNNTEYLVTALRHRSYVHQLTVSSHQNLHVEDNQRLEFLGDAVLGLCISTLLYNKFPDIKEGVMSRMRAGLVNEHQLSELARQIGVDEALLLGRGEEATGGRDKNSILADAVEAIIAAVYLDGGFEAAMETVKLLWGDLISRSNTDDFLKDFKTKLQEKTQQQYGLTPEYKLLSAQGPDHARIFEAALVLNGKALSKGIGRSKKEAEQAAAKAGLVKIEKNHTDIDLPEKE